MMSLPDPSHADHCCLIFSVGIAGKRRMGDNIYVRLLPRLRGSLRATPSVDLLEGVRGSPNIGSNSVNIWGSACHRMQPRFPPPFQLQPGL